MPLGWERINATKSSPNKNVVFIKPRTGPDESSSQEYLERIAAQCVPIMKKHHLYVLSLEEYEPNLEFWGRNFNNGEVIQLVLKSPSTGRWLPFNFVQMVFMHELAHCKEMNHSKAFWSLRNKFAFEMKALWERGYTGEGLWGKGTLLSETSFSCKSLEKDEVLPEFMCGGTYRTRVGRKRKTRTKLTSKEREEQRIRKKFGANGMTLGADEDVKLELENKKRILNKPKVARSNRGKELRAAAALARLEAEKEISCANDGEIETDSGLEIYEVYEEDQNDSNPEIKDAIDVNGKRLLDRKGQGMVKICESTGQVDDDSRMELNELFKLSNLETPDNLKENTTKLNLNPFKPSVEKKMEEKKIDHLTCPVCSFVDSNVSVTCSVCLNVLRPDLDLKSWKCDKPTCANKLYVNTGDSVFCGICSLKKEVSLEC
ncbi:DNA-dependent metalloprotease WSS1-like protein [Erysiphe neolycopersici]|uniref:DNA-dependent metalloprotease WSS1-like protein n=1 Tax=Erysiphe neolycopersici TaxID=212602 RepID=A0A420HSA4_9PEZI|nr:DNA-dependent metalloprotease WSS1-like protein [Erysiphe neolycopersici]